MSGNILEAIKAVLAPLGLHVAAARMSMGMVGNPTEIDLKLVQFTGSYAVPVEAYSLGDPEPIRDVILDPKLPDKTKPTFEEVVQEKVKKRYG